MEFKDRKVKCKKIQKTDLNGNPLPEAFYALITDEITQKGTPLNAEAMNKGNWRDDTTVSFVSNYGEPVNAKPYVTRIYTASDGETWLVPPEGQAEAYQLSAGHKALHTLRDPTTGQKGYLQDIIDNSVNLFSRPCPVSEHDNLKLTAKDYDKKAIKALNYDVCGALALKNSGGSFSGYSIFDLRDPTTGQRSYLQDIINNLFNLMTQPFTADDFDNFIPEITCDSYGNKDITAINFDMRGKSLII